MFALTITGTPSCVMPAADGLPVEIYDPSFQDGFYVLSTWFASEMVCFFINNSGIHVNIYLWKLS